jgi:hypothetical protein
MTDRSMPARHRRTRRALAIAAGVLSVPALYAVANATVEPSPGPEPAHQATGSASTDDMTEIEVEHGVVTTQPRDDAEVEDTAPASTIPERHAAEVEPPETEVEHGVVTTEPHGDDRGPGDDGPATTTTTPVTQAFTSAGGSVTVTLQGGSLSLVSTAPATGFAVEVHDNTPDRVEVRFTSGGLEWRIRVEPAGAAMTSEVTSHG